MVGADSLLTMKDYAKQFYSSRAWKNCRKAYAKSVGGLCEICLADGLIVAGEIVHHKKHINPNNVHDPEILLNWDNLQLVCRECHAKIHEADIHKNKPKRYRVDEFGRVTVQEQK